MAKDNRAPLNSQPTFTKDQLAQFKMMFRETQLANEEDTDPDFPIHIRHMYRNVFLRSEEGRKVLAHLMTIMGYRTKMSSPQEIGIHNVAQHILDILGVGSENMLYEALSLWSQLPPEEKNR